MQRRYVMSMALPEEKQTCRYTYADYCTWGDDERWELIEGVPYAMSPAPNRRHQEISRELSYQFTAFLKGKPCEVFAAPFDVRLNAEKGDNTVVQPDLLVVCDKSKLDDNGCKGAPDLIIEILSPSTSSRDKLLKFNKYLLAGIREYWIVDPVDKIVSVNTLENGKYIVNVYGDADCVPVGVLSGCLINMREVFYDPMEA